MAASAPAGDGPTPRRRKALLHDSDEDEIIPPSPDEANGMAAYAHVSSGSNGGRSAPSPAPPVPIYGKQSPTPGGTTAGPPQATAAGRRVRFEGAGGSPPLLSSPDERPFTAAAITTTTSLATSTPAFGVPSPFASARVARAIAAEALPNVPAAALAVGRPMPADGTDISTTSEVRRRAHQAAEAAVAAEAAAAVVAGAARGITPAARVTAAARDTPSPAPPPPPFSSIVRGSGGTGLYAGTDDDDDDELWQGHAWGGRRGRGGRGRLRRLPGEAELTMMRSARATSVSPMRSVGGVNMTPGVSRRSGRREGGSVRECAQALREGEGRHRQGGEW